jgi:UDP-N-acetylglucosamine 2-epimerase (non-hydrolysing)
MKIMTVLGTRPEIIRLSLIIPKLDALCDHILVHTGQNFDYRLSRLFFDQMGVREPNYTLDVGSSSFGKQIGMILSEGEKVLIKERPDRILLLGDTNSALLAILAKRMGIPVFHMEAGNRCYDDRVPEEVNRRIIDHCSDVLMPYTERSRKNLIREGVSGERIFVTGNPIFEVIKQFDVQIKRSDVLSRLGLKGRRFFLVTMHRQENVDDRSRLWDLTQALMALGDKYELPVVCSLHPRTRDRMENFGIHMAETRIQFLPPFGFFDFVHLERNARCVLSDSGTVQEECCIFNRPNVTIREVTERPETVECGSNILSGVKPEHILRCVDVVLSQNNDWKVPKEYLEEHVSRIVTRIVLGSGR